MKKKFRLLCCMAMLLYCVMSLLFPGQLNYHSLSMKKIKSLAFSSLHGNPDTSNGASLNILVLSSVGRSGSSFLGELISSIGIGNTYFFEPFRTLDINLTNQIVANQIKSFFSCQFTDDITKSKFFHKTIKQKHFNGCGKGERIRSKSKYSLRDVKKKCTAHPMRIMKTIRVRLESVKKLMEDKELDLATVHLVRDPRAVAMSMAHANWSKTVYEICPSMLEDFQQKASMEELFPNRYIFVRYEDLFENIYNKSRDIYKFLEKQTSSLLPTTKNTLPPCLNKFIHDHTSISENDKPYSTFRKTDLVWQSWRQNIEEELLTEVQKTCQSVLSALGYRTFSSLADVRNLSIPWHQDLVNLR